MKVTLASNNAGKLAELQRLLDPLGFELIKQADLGIESVEETGVSFTENALIKAFHASESSQMPAIADDSGIEIDALGGSPGIYSARFAGVLASDADNNAKLLQELQGNKGNERSARYRCVLVYVASADDKEPLICEATWEGHIAEFGKGSGGFGYDPLFYIPDLQCTAAELDSKQKNTISHRGKASQLLLAKLRESLSQ